MFSEHYFLVAANIAAYLDQANKIAKNLSITASNARAVALRAGEKAAGFKPLTEFIDRLANKTITSSIKINHVANQLSRISAEKHRLDESLIKFQLVHSAVSDTSNVVTLKRTIDEIFESTQLYQQRFILLLNELTLEIDELSKELRTAVILATLSRVESSQAEVIYQPSLDSVADNVESAAQEISLEIKHANKLVFHLRAQII